MTNSVSHVVTGLERRQRTLGIMILTKAFGCVSHDRLLDPHEAKDVCKKIAVSLTFREVNVAVIGSWRALWAGALCTRGLVVYCTLTVYTVTFSAIGSRSEDKLTADCRYRVEHSRQSRARCSVKDIDENVEAIHDVLNHAGPIEQDLRNCTVRCGDARRAMSNPERLLIVIVSAGMLLD
ncbi:hypothetical protein J6590_102929 [Homalodisca vitripennis]|nr:hypothetical protein J6590_102929 [Homalodisca vitripennis]